MDVRPGLDFSTAECELSRPNYSPASMTLGTDVAGCLYTLFFFARQTEKNENGAMQLWIMRTLLFICQRSRRQLARGYNVPLNSHYEFKSNLHHMDLQMWLQLELIVRLIQKDFFFVFLPFCCSLPQKNFLPHNTLLWNQLHTCSWDRNEAFMSVDGSGKNLLKIQGG